METHRQIVLTLYNDQIMKDKKQSSDSTSSSISTLPFISWLSSLSEEERKLLSSYGEIVEFGPNDVFINEQENQPYLYFIMSGMVSVYRLQDGNTSVLAVLGPGEAVGEIAMMIEGRASASVAAMEKTQMWRIQHSKMKEFIETYPKIGSRVLLALLSSLAQRLVSMNADLALLLSPDSVKKLFLAD